MTPTNARKTSTRAVWGNASIQKEATNASVLEATISTRACVKTSTSACLTLAVTMGTASIWKGALNAVATRGLLCIKKTALIWTNVSHLHVITPAVLTLRAHMNASAGRALLPLTVIIVKMSMNAIMRTAVAIISAIILWARSPADATTVTAPSPMIHLFAKMLTSV